MPGTEESRRDGRTGFGRMIPVLAALPAVLGLAGCLLLQVRLPPRAAAPLPPPATAETSLYDAFRDLPAAGAADARITLLDDSAEAWVERWRLLADARERLDISYFILRQDVFGIAFLGALARKAHQGLRIRVLLDAVGTTLARSLTGNDYLDTLVRTPNVSVKMYRPLRFRYLDALLILNPAATVASDHDKILLADGVRGLMGGRNIATEYFADPDADPGAFRDTDVLLEGRAMGAALQRIFETQFAGDEAHAVHREKIDLVASDAELELAFRTMEAWLRGEALPADAVAGIRSRGLPWLEELNAAPQLRRAWRGASPVAVTAPVRLLDSRTRLPASDDPITRGLIRLVETAREEIFIQSPYLVLSSEAVDRLGRAAARGVRIIILTNGPESSDNPMSQGVFLEQWPELLARVPNLRLFVAADTHNLHGKLAAIDRHLGLVGTYNLDPLSMAVNSEVLAAVWSERFAERLTATPRRLIARGLPATAELRIARDSAGRPFRDGDGRVVIAAGPGPSSDVERRADIQRYRKLWRGIEKLTGRGPFL
jgi:putative cardiolipin synthase